jgi:hypothetical protein
MNRDRMRILPVAFVLRFLSTPTPAQPTFSGPAQEFVLAAWA